jgi:hypothetical protein
VSSPILYLEFIHKNEWVHYKSKGHPYRDEEVLKLIVSLGYFQDQFKKNLNDYFTRVGQQLLKLNLQSASQTYFSFTTWSKDVILYEYLFKKKNLKFLVFEKLDCHLQY